MADLKQGRACVGDGVVVMCLMYMRDDGVELHFAVNGWWQIFPLDQGCPCLDYYLLGSSIIA